MTMTMTFAAAAAHHEPSCPLTAREIEVLRLAAEGRSSKETAIKLSLSFRTVEHQIASAKRKLGARNVVHAVTIALMRKLIGFPH